MDQSLMVFPVGMCILLYFTMFGTSLANFGVHFIYRNKEWICFNATRVFIWITCPLILGIVYTISTCMFFGMNEATEQFMRVKVLQNNSIDNLSFIGFYIYPVDQNGKEYVNWHSIFGLTAVSTLITISISMMLYFGTRCYTKLHSFTELSTVSHHYRSIQNELFFALVIQAAIPLCLMHLPSTIIAITCFMNSAPESLGPVTAIFISFYPVLDPLPNIFIIKPYRNAFLNLMFCWKPRLSETSLQAVNSFNAVAINIVGVMEM
ncbi:hypothetical protein GCK72_015463 [Caenorhabditis remanei]|uniref:Seven TM Receptor n=1 Tax=Caenorhabditis remanei TaxID=31234 RepID=A0A6A5GX60_CAERE|nr:hypothetical protein GCK72_015463 [Caenorhabditis remanei]KAF1759003.1 hypothetical protein GCK72_015463 [Caenorhabditis remanei]